jgi:NAD(P)-dependent dehydrogenase (short-subunit alcohol dehydrogenase family)
MGDSLPADVQAKYAATVPVGRPAETSEIADAVLFLTTDQARYITGTTIHVNGAMYS